VLVIEEINRGNPAQIFGELLTLLEAGKRTPRDAMQLGYPDADGVHRPVHVPENLFVIGTMNTADRSLALVDLAFRRRFAFINLEPSLGEPWRNWVVNQKQM
jgi:5-methylcytosine-specific restriction protein B